MLAEERRALHRLGELAIRPRASTKCSVWPGSDARNARALSIPEALRLPQHKAKTIAGGG